MSRLRGLVAGLGGATAAIVASHKSEISDNFKTSSWIGFKPLVAETEENNVSPVFKHKTWDWNWDHRQAEDEEPNENKNKPLATRNIILIRHGQYNLDGTKDSERYLTSLGIEQAKLTGLRLAELSLPFTHIAQSRMTRAVQTAKIISEALPDVPLLAEDGLLNEGAPIAPEPLNRWKPQHYEDGLLNEGEPVQEEPASGWIPYHEFAVDGARIEAAFRKYFHRADVEQEKDSYEVIVCHANVIRYFVCRALQLPPEAWLRISLMNASTTWLVIRPNGDVHCRGLGEAGHMPPEMRTTT